VEVEAPAAVETTVEVANLAKTAVETPFTPWWESTPLLKSMSRLSECLRDGCSPEKTEELRHRVAVEMADDFRRRAETRAKSEGALEQWCHRTEISGHELPPGTSGPAMESMVEIYQVYGFELGSVIMISLGILVQLLQMVLVSLMKLLGNNPRYPTEERVPSSGYECGFSPFAAISSSSLVVFRQLAVYFVVFEAELVFLYPWSASLLPGSLLGSALGYYGVVPFLACLVVGFALEIQRDALKL
jgi:NADH-quinone oxidoreductase subunit A